MRARPRPRHGWLAPTASPHALARWCGSRHAAAQGTTLRRPRRARYGARKLTALSQVASPRAIGALSLHDATRVAELRARGACLGRGQVKKSGVFGYTFLQGVPPPPPPSIPVQGPFSSLLENPPLTLDACSHFARPLNFYPPKKPSRPATQRTTAAPSPAVNQGARRAPARAQVIARWRRGRFRLCVCG